MTIFGIDISNWNPGIDLHQVRAEDFRFVFAKVSEGRFRDPTWPLVRDNARDADLMLAGYLYVRGNVDPTLQAQVFAEHLGDTSIPAMLDFEAGSGRFSVFWDVYNAITNLGITVALSYIPHWYWQKIGEPRLTEVPGLIQSSYVRGQDYAWNLYQAVPDTWWAPYGGRTPDILQFTDRALVAGQYVDANAYRGTIDQFTELIRASTDQPRPAPEIGDVV